MQNLSNKFIVLSKVLLWLCFHRLKLYINNRMCIIDANTILSLIKHNIIINILVKNMDIWFRIIIYVLKQFYASIMKSSYPSSELFKIVTWWTRHCIEWMNHRYLTNKIVINLEPSLRTFSWNCMLFNWFNSYFYRLRRIRNCDFIMCFLGFRNWRSPPRNRRRFPNLHSHRSTLRIHSTHRLVPTWLNKETKKVSVCKNSASKLWSGLILSGTK